MYRLSHDKGANLHGDRPLCHERDGILNEWMDIAAFYHIVESRSKLSTKNVFTTVSRSRIRWIRYVWTSDNDLIFRLYWSQHGSDPFPITSTQYYDINIQSVLIENTDSVT